MTNFKPGDKIKFKPFEEIAALHSPVFCGIGESIFREIYYNKSPKIIKTVGLKGDFTLQGDLWIYPNDWAVKEPIQMELFDA